MLSETLKKKKVDMVHQINSSNDFN